MDQEKTMFIPEEYELPLFLNKKIRTQRRELKWCDFLKKHMITYDKIFHIEQKMNEKDNLLRQKRQNLSLEHKKIEFDCQRKPKITERNYVIENNWNLAPNRYTIRGQNLNDICSKWTGKRGPYSCFTGERNEKSFYGYSILPEKIYPLVNDFYTIQSEVEKMLNPRNHYKFQFRNLPDLKKHDNGYNGIPSPAHYYPNLGGITSVKKTHEKETPFHFYPHTTVPINRRFNYIYSDPILRQDYGRYDPFWVSCLCKSRRSNIYHPCNKHRHIEGRGHTSVFRSLTTRLLSHTFESMKLVKQRGNIKRPENFEYFHRVRHPKRKIFSFFPRVPFGRCKPVRFNTTAPVKLRRKLRAKKNFTMRLLKTAHTTPSQKKIETDEEKQPEVNTKRVKKLDCFMPPPKPTIFEKKNIVDNSLQYSIYKPFSLDDFLPEPKEPSIHTEPSTHSHSTIVSKLSQIK